MQLCPQQEAKELSRHGENPDAAAKTLTRSAKTMTRFRETPFSGLVTLPRRKEIATIPGDTIAATFRETFLEQERRRTPRYPFIATAEVIDSASRASSSTRVTELSLHGCYIEMSSPHPKGAAIAVKIYSEGKFFEAPGTVVYSLPKGIGVSFHDVHPQYLSVLKRWLLAAAMAKYATKSESRPESGQKPAASTEPREKS